MGGMVDLDEYRLVVAAGDAKGVVIRCPGAVLVARPTRPGTQGVMAQLLALCGEAAEAAQSSEASARALVRRVAGVLAGAEPEDVPDFALLVSSGERLAALVHGATDVIASGEPGEIRLSGAESATWLDRLLPASLDRIEVGPTGVVPAPANAWPDVPFPLDLRSGVVAGTGAVLLAGGGTFGGRAAGAPVGGAADRPLTGDRPVAMAKPAGADDAGSPAGGQAVADAFGGAPRASVATPERAPGRHDAPDTDGGSDWPDPRPMHTPPAGPIVPPLPDSSWPREPAARAGGPPAWQDGQRADDADGPTELGRDSYVEPVTELAGGGAAPAGAGGGPGSRAQVQVQGVLCQNGHFNNPGLLYCVQCDSPLSHKQTVWGPRPSLGVLVFDDGSAVPVDTDIVIGRQPERDDAVRTGQARPLVVEDGESAVSRVHASIHLDGWDVSIVDHGSANGTYIAPPEATTWSPLAPRQPSPLTSGTRVQVGKRTFVYDARRRDG
jgi:hypothetical protein